jgi:hypothetical protein
MAMCVEIYLGTSIGLAPKKRVDWATWHAGRCPCCFADEEALQEDQDGGRFWVLTEKMGFGDGVSWLVANLHEANPYTLDGVIIDHSYWLDFHLDRNFDEYSDSSSDEDGD